MPATFDNVGVFSLSASIVNSGLFTIGGGANRCLSIFPAEKDGNEPDFVITSVTFNAVAAIPAPVPGPGVTRGGNLRGDVYYLLEADLPPAGEYTVSVNYAGTVSQSSVAMISLSGVAQQPPEAVSVLASGGSALTFSDSITTLTNDVLVVGYVAAGSGSTFTSDGVGQIEQLDNASVGNLPHVTISTTSAAIAGVVTQSYTHNSSVGYVGIMTAWAPATTQPVVFNDSVNEYVFVNGRATNNGLPEQMSFTSSTSVDGPIDSITAVFSDPAIVDYTASVTANSQLVVPFPVEHVPGNNSTTVSVTVSSGVVVSAPLQVPMVVRDTGQSSDGVVFGAANAREALGDTSSLTGVNSDGSSLVIALSASVGATDYSFVVSDPVVTTQQITPLFKSNILGHNLFKGQTL